MSNNFIPVNTPLLGGNEKKYINECIDTGWISSEGPFVEKFEVALSHKVNRKHGIACSSGTAALDIAVAALDIGNGDEVILPSHTIISCVSAIIKAGAKPVLVDSELTTWNMDVNIIEEKITKKTKAIMAVHLYGLPLDMDKILELAQKYNLLVIEDAAQMIGQTYKNKPCGGFGDISITSFYPNKQITTGEGGMCMVNDEKLAQRCKSFRNLCFKQPRFVHDELGWNYRMTNIQAALGLAQTERLDEHVKLKRKTGNMYLELLKNINTIHLPLKSTDYAENIFWVFGILLKDDYDFTAKQIIEKLSKSNIGARPFFYPLHLQPVFKKIGLFIGEQYPNSEKLATKGLYLPSGLGASDAQVIQSAKTFIKLL